MTVTDFITKWVSKEADWDNFYQGQCVDLFRYYCDEILEIDQPAGVWGAANFWSNFESDPILVKNFTKVLNTSDFTPQEGDVMVWNFNAGGGFGHIAICTGENTGTQYFHSFDQNWSRVSYCEVVNHSYKNVYGVLRPVSSTNQIMQSKLLTHMGVKDENEAIAVWDKEMAFLKDARSKIDGLREEIDRLKSENSESYAQAELRKKELQKFLEDLAKKLFLPSSSDQTDVLGSIDRLLTVEDQLTKANKTISQKEADFAKKEVGWQAEIDELKGIIEKMSVRLEKLETDIESGKESKADFEWFGDFVAKIKSLFNK